MLAARQFITDLPKSARVVITCHGDADGLGASVLMSRGLERLGFSDVGILPAGKGEHVHEPHLIGRLEAERLSALIVLDMGSRGEPVEPPVPALLVDHHQPRGFPPNAVVLSSFADEFVAPTSLLVSRLLRGLVDLDDSDWLALVGTVGDLGAGVRCPEVASLVKKYRRKDITETVALINAAKRSGAHDVGAALDVLQVARSPEEIASGRVPGVQRLAEYRREVHREVQRCAKAPPRFAGQVAMLQVQSPAQVHPLLAVRWANRLKDHIVFAANEEYLPGRVNFSVRSRKDIDLVAFLRELPLDDISGDFAFGHTRATGGSLSPKEFSRMLSVLGFEPTF